MKSIYDLLYGIYAGFVNLPLCREIGVYIDFIGEEENLKRGTTTVLPDKYKHKFSKIAKCSRLLISREKFNTRRFKRWYIG